MTGSGPIFRRPNSPTAYWSDGKLVRRPIIPTTHKSDSPLVRRPNGPTDDPLVRRLIGPTVNLSYWSTLHTYFNCDKTPIKKLILLSFEIIWTVQDLHMKV